MSKFLKTYSKKIYTDLDVFFSFFKNDCITVTGTNGKSTTCQLLYEILLKQKFDVRLVGNIGNPILSLSKIKPKTIFVVEASSYQLEYSKIFKSKFAVILNITPDHIERHRTIKKYVTAKFKLIKNQSKQCLCFLKKGDFLIEEELKVLKIKSKIIKVDTLKYNKILHNLKNDYFLTEANKENLTFALAIADKLKLDKKILFNTIQNFKGLRYRQQIVYKKSNLIIINDSKSTSFPSSLGVLKIIQTFIGY